eukprot:218327-Alexandrium_andersonii.AAC.1
MASPSVPISVTAKTCTWWQQINVIAMMAPSYVATSAPPCRVSPTHARPMPWDAQMLPTNR